MVKKVRFSDKVDVRYMNVSLKEHSREVKNPIGYQESLSKKTTYFGNESIDSCFPPWVWWIIGIVLMIIVIYFLWKFYYPKNNNQDRDEFREKNNDIHG